VLGSDTELTENKILRFCSLNLENFMVPKYIHLMESLPKTSTGKVDKLILGHIHRESSSSQLLAPVAQNCC